MSEESKGKGKGSQQSRQEMLAALSKAALEGEPVSLARAKGLAYELSQVLSSLDDPEVSLFTFLRDSGYIEPNTYTEELNRIVAQTGVKEAPKAKASAKKKTRKPREIANPFGPYGMKKSGIIPNYKRASVPTIAEAVRVFTQVDFLEESEVLLEGLRVSKRKVVRYKGIRQIVKHLYLMNGQQYNKQHLSTQLRKRVGELINVELAATGEWNVRESMMVLGAAACAVAGEKTASRPFLPLVGLLLIIKYRMIAINGIQPGVSDADIERSAYSLYGYFSWDDLQD